MTDIVVPADLWDTDDEGVLFLWVYPDGTVVEKGKLIAELTVEESPARTDSTRQWAVAHPRGARDHHQKGQVLV
jgi:hypothetical protein